MDCCLVEVGAGISAWGLVHLPDFPREGSLPDVDFVNHTGKGEGVA